MLGPSLKRRQAVPSAAVLALTVVPCGDAERTDTPPDDNTPACELNAVGSFPAWKVEGLATGTRILFRHREDIDGTLVFTAEEANETTIELDGNLLPIDLRIPDVGESFVVTNHPLVSTTTALHAYYRFDSDTNGLWAEASSLFASGDAEEASRFKLIRRSDTPLCDDFGSPFESWVAGAETDDGLVELEHNRATAVAIEGRVMTFAIASAGRLICDCTDAGGDLGGWAFIYQPR